MVNIIIDVWLRDQVIYRFDEVDEEENGYVKCRLEWVESYKSKVGENGFGISVWFE